MRVFVERLIRPGACVALMLTLSSCARYIEERPKALPDISLPRWDASDYLTRPGYNPNEASPGKIAIDHAGNKLAFAVPGMPSGGLLILDLTSDQAVLLDNATPSVEYVQPSFSRDGSKIVFLATPVPRFGWTETWIASVDGRYERRLNGCTAMARAPEFSPDASRVIFYRSLLTSDSTKWPSPVWPEQRSQLPVIPYAIFEHDLASNRERQVTSLVYSVPRWIEYAPNDRIVISATSLLGKVGGAVAGRENESWAPGGVTVFDSLPGGAELRERTQQTLVLDRAGSASPTIATTALLGVPFEENLVLAPSGQPVTVETLAGGGGGANAAARPFEYLYYLREGGKRDLLLDTRRAPNFLMGPQRPTSVSGNLCRVAYWGMSNDAYSITTLNRCDSSSDRERTFAINDLLRRARTSVASWRFGDACKLD